MWRAVKENRRALAANVRRADGGPSSLRSAAPPAAAGAAWLRTGVFGRKCRELDANPSWIARGPVQLPPAAEPRRGGGPKRTQKGKKAVGPLARFRVFPFGGVLARRPPGARRKPRPEPSGVLQASNRPLARAAGFFRPFAKRGKTGSRGRYPLNWANRTPAESNALVRSSLYRLQDGVSCGSDGSTASRRSVVGDLAFAAVFTVFALVFAQKR